jgi:hypothetical protein
MVQEFIASGPSMSRGCVVVVAGGVAGGCMGKARALSNHAPPVIDETNIGTQAARQPIAAGHHRFETKSHRGMHRHVQSPIKKLPLFVCLQQQVPLQFWAMSNMQVPRASGLSMPCCGALLLILSFKTFALELEHLILFAILGALLFC